MRVEIPMLTPLMATIEAGEPTGDLGYLVTRRRKPFNKGALGTAFGRRREPRPSAANRPTARARRRQRGLPKTGRPSGNWRPFFGWSGGQMATLYTKSANRSRLAAEAIGKLDRAETENRTSIPAPMAEVRAGNRKS